MRFRQRTIELPFATRLSDVQPLGLDDRQRWLAWTLEGDLLELDLDTGTITDWSWTQGGREAFDGLLVSPDDRLVAVVVRYGRHGVVYDRETRRVTMRLDRGEGANDQCVFPLAFAVIDDRLVLIHATSWNRLDLSDPYTGRCLTIRIPPGSAEPHYLDSFHCGLIPSPDGANIAGFGGVAPSFGVTAWSLSRWLTGNAWESEDGPTRRLLHDRALGWDYSLCWLDGRRLAVLVHDGRQMETQARIFDAVSGTTESSIPGPGGYLFHDDGVLFAGFGDDGDHGIAAWDVVTGERLLEEADAYAHRWHHGARSLLTVQQDEKSVRVVLRKLIGRPFPAAWRTRDVHRVAEGIAAERSFADLPVLADALEEAGCSDTALLGHCRQQCEHGHECWAIDRILDVS